MTAIEWTDATWNPIVGCSITSPGCTNCYAMRQARRVSVENAQHRYWIEDLRVAPAGVARIVRDTSVNHIAHRGDYLVVAKIDARDGDLVVIARSERNLLETSAKRYDLQGSDMIELRNDSDDPRYDRSIRFKPANKTAEDGSPIEIMGVVVGVWREVEITPRRPHNQ